MTSLGVALVGLLGIVIAVAIWELSLRRAVGGASVASRAPFSARRLLFTAAVGGYGALAADRLGDDWPRLGATLVFTIPLLMTLLIDAWTRLIHTDILLAGLLAGFGFAALAGLGTLLASLLGAAGAATVFAGFYLLAKLIYRRAGLVPFGLGDVYLAAMIGAMVRGEAVIQALFAGVLLAAIASLVLLVTRRAGRHDPLPYGPFLCLGALLTLL